MEILFKGSALAPTQILSKVIITQVRFFNPASRTYFEAFISNNPTPDSDGYYDHTLEVTAEMTGEAPVGLYNLELIYDNGKELVIEACYENYAKLMESSLTY